MGGLWRYADGTREGKYLVLRRDGTVPDWPHLVMGARDPAVPAALLSYANACERIDETNRLAGLPPLYGRGYCNDVRDLAAEFTRYRDDHGSGDPGAPKHRPDDPSVVAKMREARARGGGSA